MSNGKIVDICDFEDTSRTNKDIIIDEKQINEKHIGDFFEIKFKQCFKYKKIIIDSLLQKNLGCF